MQKRRNRKATQPTTRPEINYRGNSGTTQPLPTGAEAAKQWADWRSGGSRAFAGLVRKQEHTEETEARRKRTAAKRRGRQIRKGSTFS